MGTIPCPSIPPDIEVEGFDNLEGDIRAKESVIRSKNDMIDLRSKQVEGYGMLVFRTEMLDASSLFVAVCTVSRSLLGDEKKKGKARSRCWWFGFK